MNNFIPKTTLKNEIEKGVPIRIRAALLNYFMQDRADEKKQINPAISYTEKEFPQLWQEHDEVNYPMKRSKSEWDDNYYNLQSLYCNDNFSKERINHLLEVGKHLYSRPKATQTNSPKQNAVKKNTAQAPKKNTKSLQKTHKQNPQKKNMTPLILTLLIIAIVVVVVLVLMLNNNQRQAILNPQNQYIRALKQLEEVFIGKSI